MNIVAQVEVAVANLGSLPRAEALRYMRSHYLWRAWKQRDEPREVAAWVLRARIAHALLLGRPIPAAAPATQPPILATIGHS